MRARQMSIYGGAQQPAAARRDAQSSHALCIAFEIVSASASWPKLVAWIDLGCRRPILAGWRSAGREMVVLACFKHIDMSKTDCARATVNVGNVGTL